MGEQVLELGHSGRLLENAFVLYDRGSGSQFCQATGACLIGPLKGRTLARLPAWVLPWKTWRALHPDTRVLAPPGGTGIDYTQKNVYADYDRSSRIGIHPLSRLDDRLPPKALVLGLEQGGEARCWTARALAKERVRNDRVGGRDVVVAWDPAGAWGAAFERDPSVRFSAGRDGSIADDRGSRWDMAGRCVEGAARGGRLRTMPAVACYWFSWQAHHPKTSVDN